LAVIGGGVAGITFAAAAGTLGAKKVELFERSSQVLDLQLGCWHRPLHPEIFTWPEDTAYLPVSHLPLLGWSTGRAHDVAEEMRSKFENVCAGLKEKFNEERIKIRKKQRAVVKSDGGVVVGEEAARLFDVVVLAVGFGTEENPFDLPWNSGSQ
jgi:NADPH-dependent 2,4-dienoyl-CoA reductase/sulfur reductase-like enzyme